MNQFEDNTHVFILRIWLEPRKNDNAAGQWRGIIEYIKTGERRYFVQFDVIPKILWDYLEIAPPSLVERKLSFQWLRKALARLFKQGR